jgi:hypothetical protein
VGVAGSNPVIPTKLKATTDKSFSEKRKKISQSEIPKSQKNSQKISGKQSENQP